MSPTSSPRHSSHARRKQGHRRQFSDPKLITAVSPLKEDLMKADIERVSILNRYLEEENCQE